MKAPGLSEYKDYDLALLASLLSPSVPINPAIAGRNLDFSRTLIWYKTYSLQCRVFEGGWVLNGILRAISFQKTCSFIDMCTNTLVLDYPEGVAMATA